MSDTLEIPKHVREAARAVEIFFKLNSINEWALMGIQSRNKSQEVETMEYCEDCNFPLSACGEQNIDGTPSMDCQVCKLRDLLAAERAAREAADRRIAFLEEAIASSHKERIGWRYPTRAGTE